MSFTDAIAHDPTATGPVVKMKVRKSKLGASIISFSMSKAFIGAYLSGLTDGEKIKVQHGTGDDLGKILITRAKGGTIPVKLSPKGAGVINVTAWRGHTNSEHALTACHILMASGGGVVIKDPFKG